MTKVDRDIMVLANPEIAESAQLGDRARGGGRNRCGAVDRCRVAARHLVGYLARSAQGHVHAAISEKNELMASRIAMAFAIVLAGWLGLNPPGFAAQVVALAFGLAASSIFPALMMGIFNKRVNSTGAIAGMLSGLSATLLYIFWFKGWFFVPGTAMAANTPTTGCLASRRRRSAQSGALMNFAVAYGGVAVRPRHRRNTSSTSSRTSVSRVAPERVWPTSEESQVYYRGHPLRWPLFFRNMIRKGNQHGSVAVDDRTT